MRKVTVPLGERAYDVIVGEGALGRLAEVIPATAKRAAIVTQVGVPVRVEEHLDPGIASEVFLIGDGEQHKTLDTLRAIYNDLLAAGADRATLIVGLGGGVIGDVAGFAAATFMRGVPFIQAPTSLLAMVDASIGGKVGVDLPQGKNLAGAFKDPLAVFADTDALATLPEIEWRCGMAEVLKAALIGDPPLLDDLPRDPVAGMDPVIARAIAVKIAVVNQDRLEHGPRAYLNLGHTFAHAIEQVSGYAWKHGQAVAVGMVAAARLAERRGVARAGLAGRVEVATAALGLPVSLAGLEPADLWDAMGHDKKWRDGAATFVLLEEVGSPVIVRDVPRADVLAVLDGLREDA